MRRPIFIVGQMQRTGTNFLSDLITAHPDACSFAPIMEDHLLQRSSLLGAYADIIERGWTQGWGVPVEERERLVASLAGGLSDFVSGRDETRHVVTKMPSSEGLEMGKYLLASATLLVLVRDGRDVCESIHNSFDWSYERAMRTWARSATQVATFHEECGDHGNYRFVRYEELVEHPHDSVSEILEVCGLDASHYDFSAIDELPVRGSSTLRSEGDHVHWQAQPRSDEFLPLERSQSWDASLHQRYATLAGAASRRLGYQCEVTAKRSIKSDLGYVCERAYYWGRKGVRTVGGFALRRVRGMTQSTKIDRS
ncbi:MAG: sulfotransferase [Acidimicrobiales bacterium]